MSPCAMARQATSGCQYGLYRNVEGSFQMTQLGVFPISFYSSEVFWANRTLDWGGPDLICHLSGEIFTRVDCNLGPR